MALQCVAEGATQRSCSNATASTVMTTAVMAVIQNEMASVGTGMRVRRSSCVPSAQVLAATRASSTPWGWPVRCVISCHSSSTTPNVAAATPAQARPASRWPKNSAPSTAENMGMV